MEVKGKVALVTGANRGLGRALVLALQAAGVSKVYGAVRKLESLDVSGAIPVRLDVTDLASAEAAAKQCPDVQILINNAGLSIPGPILADGADANIRSLMDTNFFGIWNVSKAFAPILGRNGGGAIVNVLSVLSWIAFEGTTPYSASKAAAWALTNGMRRELKNQGTSVAAVHVGYMDTDMTAGMSNVPKSSPRDVAKQIIADIEAGTSEILADDISRSVKSGLGAPAAPYL